MVTLNAHFKAPQVENEVHQHAFILVGEKQLFGVHMTQFHCELHKYQVVLKLTLPDDIYEEYLNLQRQHPKDTFVLCNAKNRNPIGLNEVRSFSIPELGSGMVTKFTANIFQGIRPLSPAEMAADSHFFPWAKKYTNPALGEFEVKVERIVTFRPFDHLLPMPEYARYLIFGDSKSGESHMTNLQTANLLTNEFEPKVFGPDYDHVMSLAERPDWLEQDSMLEAGVVITTPIVQLTDPDTGQHSIPAQSPFKEGDTIDALYRGLGPTRSVKAGSTYLYATAVCNSPLLFAKPPLYASFLDKLPEVPEVIEISLMPKRYWAFPETDEDDLEEKADD